MAKKPVNKKKTTGNPSPAKPTNAPASPPAAKPAPAPTIPAMPIPAKPAPAKPTPAKPAAAAAPAHALSVDEVPAGPWLAGATGIARIVCLIAGPLTILAGGVGTYAAFRAQLGAQAFLEIVIVLSGIVALLIGLRILRGGLGISLASIAATVLIAAILTDPSVRFAITSGSTVPARAGIDIVLLFIARATLAMLFAAAAAITVIERHPKRSLTLLAKAVVAMIPFIAVAGAWVVPGIRNAITGIHPIVTGFASTLSLIIACGLFSMAVHWTIQAFEAGRTLGRQPLGS